jgi:hypothetical protein
MLFDSMKLEIMEAAPSKIIGNIIIAKTPPKIARSTRHTVSPHIERDATLHHLTPIKKANRANGTVLTEALMQSSLRPVAGISPNPKIIPVNGTVKQQIATPNRSRKILSTV